MKAMETMTVQSTNKDGVMSDYTGVSLERAVGAGGRIRRCDRAGLGVADDGFTAEVTLADPGLHRLHRLLPLQWRI